MVEDERATKADQLGGGEGGGGLVSSESLG